MSSTAVITGMHTVGVPVTDQDTALAFYTGTLGLTTRIDAPMGNGSRWIEVAAEGAATSIALIPAEDEVPAGVETGIRLTTGSADDCHARLTAAGADVDSVLRWPGVPPMFALRDQDGNGLEIIEQS
jgi:lactoylglutathione lyase